MYKYRITKYNPKYRNKNGIYEKDEWTSISDIGKNFQNEIFTLKQYLEIETKYINAIKYIVDYLKVDTVEITSLEKSTKTLKIDNILNNYDTKLISIFNEIHNSKIYPISEIDKIAILILREKLWCNLRRKYRFYIHFGWDYYMYVGISKKSNDFIFRIEKDGLFVEEMK